MIYLIIYCFLLTAFTAYIYRDSVKERERLVEMIMAKNLADYKSLDIKVENNKEEHKNMINKREKENKRLNEVE